MKILHVDETFHPAFGYQCNPLAKFQAKQGHEVSIVTVEGAHLYPVYFEFGDRGEHLTEQDARYESETGVSIVRVPARGYFARRLVYRYGSLYSAIDKINPDAILVHCLETLTATVVLRRYADKYPLVFDSHMLTMASQNPLASGYEAIFRKFITPGIVKHAIHVIKTQNDSYVTEKLGVPQDLTQFISFGTDTDLFAPNKGSREAFLLDNNVQADAFIVVSTGKMSESKGGQFFAKSIEAALVGDKPVVFVIVANFDGEYEQCVKQILGKSENAVLFYPVQNYLSLPYFYQIADACIFPRQCSMSFYDAQACGAPVISEANNINIERNSHGNGLCFRSGDVDSLRNSIIELANMDTASISQMRDASRAFVVDGYSYETIAANYTKVLVEAYENFGATNTSV